MEKGNRGHVPGVLDLQPFAAELETSHGGGTAKGREMSGCKLCLVSPCLQQIKLVSTTRTTGVVTGMLVQFDLKGWSL